MLIVSQDGQGDFTSIQAAVDSLPEAADGGDREILIKKGTYRERVAVWKDGVRLVGEDAAETVLTWSASAQHADSARQSAITNANIERTVFMGDPPSYCSESCQASAAPSALQAARPSSSGASFTVTLSAARVMPFSAQRASQVRIHSPSPQP